VILGDAMKAACAGHHGPQVYDIGGDGGGTLDDPAFWWLVEIPGVDPGHSAVWTWDGQMLVFGWEPGGGVDARCQETSTDLERSLLFFDGETGDEVGGSLRAVPTTTWCRCATGTTSWSTPAISRQRCHRLHRPLQPERDRVE
jgi:hypothetical protein